MKPEPSPPSPIWPIWVGLFVALGSAATVAPAVVESWAG